MAPRDDSTRQRILSAAGEIFAESGFQRATIRDIIRRANVNLAAVNYHFGNKESLYRATIHSAHQSSLEQAPLPEWNSGTPPEQQLRAMVHVLLQRMLIPHRGSWQMRLMLREHFQPTGVCQELVEEFIRPQHEAFRKVLSALAPPGTPDWKLDQFSFSMIGQGLFYKLASPIVEMLIPESTLRNHFTPSRLADHITDVMLAALRMPLADGTRDF